MNAAVRPARPGDREPIARVLARAFADDPVARWIHPSGRARPRRLERVYRARLDALLPHGLTWTTADHAGAALWAPADAWRVPVGEIARNLPAYWSRHAPLVAVGWHAVEARHPVEPHLYLAILGVDPAAQGRGVGSALVAPALERCDREGIGAYLESSKAQNVPFYECHGFRVTGELDLPRGPRLWLMWREPQ